MYLSSKMGMRTASNRPPDAGARLAELPADKRERMGVQSATLQAGYLILAARSLGLDCGPMGGFDAATVDAAFFAGTSWHSLLLVNLGSGDAAKLQPARAPARGRRGLPHRVSQKEPERAG